MERQSLNYQTIQLSDSVIVSSFSTAFVMISCCAMVTFLCSPTATRGVLPARSWRARAPAMTTNSNELDSLLLSIMRSFLESTPPETGDNNTSIAERRALDERSDDAGNRVAHAVQPGALGQNNPTQPVNGDGQLIVDHDVVVLLERSNLFASDVEPAPNRAFRVFASSAEPLLQRLE